MSDTLVVTKKKKYLTTNEIQEQDKREQEELQQLHFLSKMSMHLNSTLSRAMQYRTGDTYSGDRNMWLACGYPEENPSFEDYMVRYKRGDIATRIVDAYPDATWKEFPTIVPEKDKEKLLAQIKERVNKGLYFVPEETEITKTFNSLVTKLKLQNLINRADKLAGVGHYAVLFLGFNDVSLKEDMTNPVGGVDKKKKGKKLELKYVQPYSEGRAKIKTVVTDVGDERFGEPEIYTITVGNDEDSTKTLSTEKSSGITMDVHWTRIIHMAEFLLEDNYLSTPRLERVWNRLIDLDKIVGGSAEMFWQGAFPPLNFKMDPNTNFGPAEKTAMKEEIKKMVNGLQRYTRMIGVDMQSVTPIVASPKDHFDVQLQLISGAEAIPRRILVGSEQGKLASDQDQENWSERVSERQLNYAGPQIVRPLVDRLQLVGVLPAGDYEVLWPNEGQMPPEKRAEITAKRMRSLRDYVDAQGADLVLPAPQALREIFDFTEYELQEIEMVISQLMKRQVEQEAEDAAELERQMQEQADSFAGTTEED
jgi:hypothetical protein